MRARHGAFATGNYSPVPGSSGGSAVAALSNYEAQIVATQNISLTTVSLDIPAFTPIISGVLFITTFMYVVDSTPGEAVTFVLQVGGVTVARSVVFGDAAGNASASFAVFTPALLHTGTDLNMTASAAHALAIGTQSLNVIELPA